MKAWAAAGVALSHNAAAQYYSTKHVARNALQPGDLVYFGRPIHHVGIYIGGGKFIEAPYTGARSGSPTSAPATTTWVRRGPEALPSNCFTGRPPYDDGVTRTLVVTNDFPPRAGGIQSFVHELVARLDDVVVYAPAWEGAAAFDAAQSFEVVRHPSSLMLPTRGVSRRAAALLKAHRCDAVWFGAAAPLGLLAPALRAAGARRIVATTHGHEAGWAQLPVARQTLRRIGDRVDVVTYLGEYTRGRLERALSASAQGRLERLAPGVDTSFFKPGAGGDVVRHDLGLADRRVIVCVSRLVPRKGQDVLLRALARGAAVGTRRGAVDRRRRTRPQAARGDQLIAKGSGPPSVSADPSRGRICPRTTTRARCSRCRAARDAEGWTSRGSASCTSRRPRPGCPSSPAARVARRTRCFSVRPVTWSTAAMSLRWPGRLWRSCAIRLLRPRWVRRDARGSNATGPGTPRRRGSRAAARDSGLSGDQGLRRVRGGSSRLLVPPGQHCCRDDGDHGADQPRACLRGADVTCELERAGTSSTVSGWVPPGTQFTIDPKACSATLDGSEAGESRPADRALSMSIHARRW